jgi:hypothetical protein
METETK